MAELVLLSIERGSFLALHERAKQGDLDALRAVGALWEDYRDIPLCCFICNEDIPVGPGDDDGPRVFTHILPELIDDRRGSDNGRDKLICASLCKNCRTLPPMQLWGRSLRILRKMWSAKLTAERGKKKRVTFHFHAQQRHHHPR